MRRFLAAILVTALAAMSHGPAQSSEIVIGTGDETGVYYPVGGAICHAINHVGGSGDATCDVRETSGSVDNIYALMLGDVDFGIVQSDVQHDAFFGDEAISERPVEALRSVASLYSEAFTLVARKDAQIEDFQSLRGRKVNVGETRSGAERTMKALLAAHDMTLDNLYETSHMSAPDAGAALCSGEIDAMVQVVGHPSANLREIAKTCDIAFVPIDEDMIARLAKSRGFFHAEVIPAGLYRGVDVEIPTFGMMATIVTMKQSPDDSVRELLTSILNEFDDFRQQHRVLEGIEQAEMPSKGMTAPLHPAAEAVYRELGLMP